MTSHLSTGCRGHSIYARQQRSVVDVVLPRTALATSAPQGPVIFLFFGFCGRLSCSVRRMLGGLVFVSKIMPMLTAASNLSFDSLFRSGCGTAPHSFASAHTIRLSSKSFAGPKCRTTRGPRWNLRWSSESEVGCTAKCDVQAYRPFLVSRCRRRNCPQHGRPEPDHEPKYASRHTITIASVGSGGVRDLGD